MNQNLFPPLQVFGKIEEGLVLFKFLVEFTIRAVRSWALYSLRRFLIRESISLLVTGLFRFSVSL